MDSLAKPCMRERMSKGELLNGLFCSSPCTLVVELIAHAGYDFVILDMEHTLISPSQMEHLIITARACALFPFVRVPPDSSEWAVKVLDAGAEGVVFPRISTAEQIQKLASHCRYYPKGMRGLNVHRHLSFGTEPLLEGMARVNNNVLVVAMIEDVEGVNNAESIAKTSGVDILLEGAADLSQSLQMPWETRHPIVKEHIERIAHAAQMAGKQLCALPRVAEDYQQWIDAGVTLQILGDDRGIIRRGFASHLATFTSNNKRN